MHYIPPTQKNIWRFALFYSHFSIQRKVIFESFLYDPPGPIRRISYKILPHDMTLNKILNTPFNADRSIMLI
jgi:hypothetical protein